MPTSTSSLQVAANDPLGRLGSAGLAAAAALALTINAYAELLHTARLSVALAVLLLVHLVKTPHILIIRETLLYAGFLGYMLVQLLWTDDLELALNTLVPAANFVLILILFGSLASCHDLKSVVAGALLGFLVGAIVYTRVAGFPFRYPPDFSYNAIASMYLFGLLLTLLLASLGRWQRTLLVLAAAILALIVATTSIKTNLGILLGVMTAGAIHLGYSMRLLRRNAIVLLLLVAVGGYAASTSETIVESVRRGTERVALGIEILQAREDLPGYSAFEQRGAWRRQGLVGWAGNPLFGHGVEAYRDEFGVTSHATAVDLLYNSGLIGLALFYSVLISMLLRLYRARGAGMRDARAVILGSVVCYVFITLSGTMHYNAFLAAFIAFGTVLLRRVEPVTCVAAGDVVRA